MIKKETYIVEGMSCNHCKMAVEKEVKALPGMASATVDLAKKTLSVEYDGDKTGPAAIRRRRSGRGRVSLRSYASGGRGSARRLCPKAPDPARGNDFPWPPHLGYIKTHR